MYYFQQLFQKISIKNTVYQSVKGFYGTFNRVYRVMSQSQIDDGDISSDKLRNEYIMGRIEYRKLKITLEE